ncbi:RNA methyltransferase, partial [Piscinibacter sakaiensis]|uniref:RNA methyltransferase n=2 Tax=Piscinibacter sakaiensis TaxID=1547922 RepID=UPI0006B638FB
MTPPLPPTGPATRFVLVGTSHPGNVGSAARAIKVMGFEDLVLVAPRDRWLHAAPQARALASGATDVLERVRVVATLGEALDGIDVVCATAMTPRDFGPPVHAPRELLPRLAAAGERVAFVFGSERVGLANDDVYRCHAALSIPTPPGYGSLNLAQAVQLIAYDWRSALGAFPVQARTRPPVPADAAAVQQLVQHWREALQALGFLDPAVPRKLMARLHQLVLRARVREEELHILRGIARAVIAQAGGAAERRRSVPAAPAAPAAG